MLVCLNITLYLAWQIAERASTRLVARGTATEVTPTQQPRYSMQVPFYQPFGMVVPQGVPIPPPQQRPHAQKRQALENEETAAPTAKKRKAKPKGKTAADGTAVTGRAYYLVSAA